jgi:hypothetical protein
MRSRQRSGALSVGDDCLVEVGVVWNPGRSDACQTCHIRLFKAFQGIKATAIILDERAAVLNEQGQIIK